MVDVSHPAVLSILYVTDPVFVRLGVLLLEEPTKFVEMPASAGNLLTGLKVNMLLLVKRRDDLAQAAVNADDMSDMLFREFLNVFLHGDMKIPLSAPFMERSRALFPSSIVELVEIPDLPMSRSFLTPLKREHGY